MNALDESVREQLRKIQALAEKGVGGEAENARRMLERLCEKHGVSPESLVSNEETVHRFPIVDARRWELFKSCAFFVLRRNEIKFWKKRKAVEMRLTEVDAIDLRACFTHYSRAYVEEEELFFDAFVHKNRIYGPPSESPEEPAPIDRERLERLIAMMRGMKSNTWTRPAAALTE